MRQPLREGHVLTAAEERGPAEKVTRGRAMTERISSAVHRLGGIRVVVHVWALGSRPPT